MRILNTPGDFQLKTIVGVCSIALLFPFLVEANDSLKGNADRLRVNGKVLVFEFDTLPDPPELRFPRLRSRMKSVRWDDDAENKLTLKPEPEEWIVSLKQQPDVESLAVRLELLDPPIIGTEKIVTKLGVGESAIELPAHFAEVHGEKLRFEPQPHKNTIGYWTVLTDWVEWHLDATSPGNYAVEIFQGCGKGQGGSSVDIVLVKEKQIVDQISFDVEDTGHFQNFKLRNIGALHIPKPGEYQLQIRPQSLANKAVMDVRKIVLTPVRK